ncbi:O-antigen ligase family protein [Flagellimonas sediminis]|uniref:O-antigen ligase family protein n=1 Tax=Flagellimonas sediminis TaxID=2696468 RepID=A0A6I5KYW4_9FLAO|nr:O-antigen ligase family protein [Allomuricauda sediminis]NDV42641.1 hypothetical protein [Allomuricauda sediminis]
MKALIHYFKHIGFIYLILLVIYLVNPYNKGFMAGYLILGLIYTNRKFVLGNLDKTYFILVVFSFVYAAFYYFNLEQGMQWLIIYATFPPVFYLLGKKMVPEMEDTKSMGQLLIFLGIAYSLTGILSVGTNLLEGGFVQLGRSIADFWSGQERLATAMGSYFVFNMSIPGLLIVAKRRLSLIAKLALIGVFILSLLCVFRLGSRTQMALALIGILIGIAYRIKSQNLISNFKFVLVLVVLVILGINYISIDLDADYLSSLGQRLQESDNAGSAGGRTERWSKSLINLFEKPLGWPVEEFGYSHNMWFDAARNGTVISFVLLTIFTVVSIKNIIRALKVNKKATFLNSIILIFNIVIFLQFFVEPALESLYILFAFYCLIQGFINKYTENILEMDNNNVSVSIPNQVS